jgi:hypothetical protein
MDPGVDPAVDSVMDPTVDHTPHPPTRHITWHIQDQMSKRKHDISSSKEVQDSSRRLRHSMREHNRNDNWQLVSDFKVYTYHIVPSTHAPISYPMMLKPVCSSQEMTNGTSSDSVQQLMRIFNVRCVLPHSPLLHRPPPCLIQNM